MISYTCVLKAPENTLDTSISEDIITCGYGLIDLVTITFLIIFLCFLDFYTYVLKEPEETLVGITKHDTSISKDINTC